jgi:uncharacterized membrane protein
LITSTQPPPAAVRTRSGLTDPATYRLSLHLMADLVIGTVLFTIMVTLLSLSAGLMITLAGIPLLVGTLAVARSIGVIERKRARAALRLTTAAPAHEGRTWRDRLRDPADWRAVLYSVLLFPVGLVTGTVTLAGWATAAAAITSPLSITWFDSLPPPVAGIDLTSPVAVVATVLIGVVLLLLMPAVVRTLARLDAVLVRRLLVP